jgi:hypothetical protein
VLAGGYCFALSLLVYVKNRDIPLARIFALSNILLGLWNFSDALVALCKSPELGIWAFRISYIWGILMVPAGFFLCLSVAGGDFLHRPFTKVLLGFVALLVPISLSPYLISGVEYTPVLSEVPGPLYPLFVMYYAGWLGYGVYSVYQAYRAAASPQRNQLKYFFLGFFFAFCGALTFFVSLWIPAFPPVYYVLEIFYTSIMAYAIVKHRLMDVQLVFRYATVYLLYLLAVGFPLGVVMYFGKFRLSGFVWLMAMAALAPAGFSALQKALTEVVDKLPPFQGKFSGFEEIAYQTAHVAKAYTLEDWSHRVLAALGEYFSAVFGTVYVRKAGGPDFLVMGEKRDGIPGFISGKSQLVRHLRETRDIIFEDSLSGVGSMAGYEEMQAEMRMMKVKVTIPYFYHGQVWGLVNVGEKRDGKPFNVLDSAALRLFAGQTEMSFLECLGR